MADPPCECCGHRRARSPWGDAVRSSGLKAADRLMAAYRKMIGAAEGFVVPVRESDGALLSAAFCGDVVDVDPDVRAALHLAGYDGATRDRELARRSRSRQAVHSSRTKWDAVGCWSAGPTRTSDASSIFPRTRAPARRSGQEHAQRHLAGPSRARCVDTRFPALRAFAAELRSELSRPGRRKVESAATKRAACACRAMIEQA